MKKLILHIGPQKTGTTYIQKCLLDHRTDLEASQTYYPDLFFSYYGHHDLSTYYTFNAEVAGFKDSLARLKRTEGNVILSSENLSNAAIESVARMKEDLAVENIIVLYYLRRPTNRLTSLWHELVKHGNCFSFPEFAMQQLTHPLASRALNPLITLDIYAGAFGKDRLRLVDYDQAAAERSLLKTFFAASGLPPLVPDRDGELNRMLDLAEVEVIRALNIRARTDGWLNSSNVRELYFETKPNLLPTLNEIFIGIKRFNTTFSNGNTLIDHVISENVMEKYGSQLFNSMSSLEPGEIQVPTTAWMLNKNIVEAVDEIYVSLKKLSGHHRSISANTVDKEEAP